MDHPPPSVHSKRTIFTRVCKVNPRNRTYARDTPATKYTPDTFVHMNTGVRLADEISYITSTAADPKGHEQNLRARDARNKAHT